MADLMLKERKRLGLEAYDLRALRYRGDDDRIAAYSGHATQEMIAKYAGEARQIMRAHQARDKPQSTERDQNSSLIPRVLPRQAPSWISA
ncbi:hypothetical protein [Paracoccus ravus]|uniref:hypothetical protein n=1 Tax=Paracoccus ravus TaxID=2447760 RepID=UPI001ADBA02B|nr:hypothetical protein [Paracoccus ravus]